MTVFCLYFRTPGVVLLAPLPICNSTVNLGRFQQITSDRSYNFELKNSGFYLKSLGIVHLGRYSALWKHPTLDLHAYFVRRSKFFFSHR